MAAPTPARHTVAVRVPIRNPRNRAYRLKIPHRTEPTAAVRVPIRNPRNRAYRLKIPHRTEPTSAVRIPARNPRNRAYHTYKRKRVRRTHGPPHPANRTIRGKDLRAARTPFGFPPENRKGKCRRTPYSWWERIHIPHPRHPCGYSSRR